MQTYCNETFERVSEREDFIDSNSKDNDDDINSRKYLLRQIFVCSGIWSCYFCYGLSFGSPTVIIPQLRRDANSTGAISIEMASWLSSTYFYSGIACAILFAILARLIGRKLSFLIICITSLIANILLYWSKTVTHILISEIIHGPLIASPTTISIMVLTEYVSPRYRGIFLTLKSATCLWGVWVANAIGTFTYWKNIPLLACICSTYSLITALICPESPYWLTTVNRLQDCAASHRWLKGRSMESEAELKVLIQSRKMSSKLTSPKFHHRAVRMLTSESFYKPILISLSILSLHKFTGKIACVVYSIDIINRITGTESTAYTGMLILDGITVVGMYVGCGMSKFLKRRTFLLVSCTILVMFLFCLSLYLYLIHLKVLVEDTIISMTLLIGYSLAVSVGPMTISPAILSEIIPVKYRSSSVLLLGCFDNLLIGSILKISPFVLNYTGPGGLFLTFAVFQSLFVLINYKVLPETKDKTLLEIQERLLSKKQTQINAEDK